jgi:hypothetical protein
MENENIITLRLRLTRRSAILIVTAFFLCWHPGFLGSESMLKSTTYYPAPFGGYETLLTSGRTTLARAALLTDAKSYVMVGSGYNGTNAPRANTVKLEVGDSGGNGYISTSGNVRWAVNNNAALTVDQGGSIELGGTGGTPYIDFSLALLQDYSARLWLPLAGRLEVVGDFSVAGGMIKDACVRVAPAAACPSGKVPTSSIATGFPAVTGFLPLNNQLPLPPPGTVIGLGFSGGDKLCCKF